MNTNSRTVRLLECKLAAQKDITEDLLDYKLAWIWFCNAEDGGWLVHPVQGMYDFGLDDERPSDWLVWPGQLDVTVIKDLRILLQLGVRGYFIVNEIGTMIFEKWQIEDTHISTFMREVVFNKSPDFTTPLYPTENILERY